MKNEFWILLTILILSGFYFGSSSQSANPFNSVSQIAELISHKQYKNDKVNEKENSPKIISTKIIKPNFEKSLEKDKILLKFSNTNEHKNNVHLTDNSSTNTKIIDTICICQDSSNLHPYYNDETGLVGYESPTGKRKINAKFQDGKPFSEGMAAVFDGKRWGYINASGNYVIQPKFGGYEGDMETIVNPFVKGSAAVYLGSGNANGFADEQPGKYALIDTKGNIIKKFDCIFPNWYGYAKGSEGEYTAILNGKNVLVDSTGNILNK